MSLKKRVVIIALIMMLSLFCGASTIKVAAEQETGTMVEGSSSNKIGEPSQTKESIPQKETVKSAEAFEASSQSTEEGSDTNDRFQTQDSAIASARNPLIGPQAWTDDNCELKVQLLYPDGSPALNIPYEYTVKKSNGNGAPTIVVNNSGNTSGSDGTFLIKYQMELTPDRYYYISEMKFGSNGFKKVYADPQDPSRKIQQTYNVLSSMYPGVYETPTPITYNTTKFRNTFDKNGISQTINNGMIVLPYTEENITQPLYPFASSYYYNNPMFNNIKAQLYEVNNAYILYYQGIGIMEKYVDGNGYLLSQVPTGKKVENFANIGQQPATFSKTGLEKSFKDSSNQVWVLDTIKHGLTNNFAAANAITYDLDQSPQFKIDTTTDFEYAFYSYKKGYRVTERFVKDDLNTNLKTSYQDVLENNNYSETTSPSTIMSGLETWEFDYWTTDNGVTKHFTMPATINNVTSNKEIKYVFKKVIKATGKMSLEPDQKIVSNNSIVSWTAKVENTHASNALKTMKLKADSTWSSGLTEPLTVSIKPDGGTQSNFTVNPGDWSGGVVLTNIEIPATKSAEIKFSTTASGGINDNLLASLVLSGNLDADLKTENTVRIDDKDEPGKNPSGELGILNVPTFDFKDAVVSNTNQTYKLSGDNYHNQGPSPKNDPYVRFKVLDTTKTQWKLTAQLAQFSSTSSPAVLSTGTTLGLKSVQQAQISNYNKPSEIIGPYGVPYNLNIPSNSSPVQVAGSTSNGVFQLKLPYNSIEIMIPAHQGVEGEQFHSVLTWSLDCTP